MATNLLFTDAQLIALQARTAEQRYIDLKAWADANLANGAQAQPADVQSAYLAAYNLAERFIETMAIVGAVEEDSDYIDAGIDRLNAIVAWTSWQSTVANWQPRAFAGTVTAEAYSCFKASMTAGEKAAFLAKQATEIGALYTSRYTDRQYDWWINGIQTEAVAWVYSALAIAADNAELSATWLAAGIDYLEMSLAVMTEDGAYYEGLMYGAYGGLGGLVPAVNALKNYGEEDYFTTESDNFEHMGEFFAFGTYNNHYLEIGDSGWVTALHNDFTQDIASLYLIAHEYDNGYTQQYADTYATASMPRNFLWRDPAVTPLALTGLGNYYHFAGMDLSIWKEDWTTTGMVIVSISGINRGHNHPYCCFQIYDKGKPLSSDLGYVSGSWCEIHFKNNITEGAPFTGGDSRVYPGYPLGQAQADMGMFGQGTPEGIDPTYPIMLASVNNAYYFYTRQNGTPTNNPYSGNRGTGQYTDERFYTGALNLCTRHTVFLPDLHIMVQFDRVGTAGSATQFNWIYNANNETHDETITISIDGSVIDIQQATSGGVTSNTRIVHLVPSGTTFTSVTATDDYAHQWKYLRESITSVTSSRFLNVVYPDAADYLVPTEVSVSNCSGVIIDDDATHKTLVLFSSDGNAVNQWIDLEGYYEADDGETYTFNATQVQADFTTYQVMRLVETGSPSYPLMSGMIALNVRRSTLVSL